MKAVFAVLVLLAGLTVVPSGLAQCPVSLYVDTAPNVYGSPDWDPWWTATKADIAAGSFIDMRSSSYTAGTHWLDPYDEIVYSTMDLGRRLHWMYWVPGATVADLDGLFEAKWVIDWGGTNWTYEDGGWAEDGAEVGWSQPTKWEDYDDGSNQGVIGSLGFAWWATDDEALPFTTDGNPYNEVDQADIDALRGTVLQYQTFATGYVRCRADEQGEWQMFDLQTNVVPEPGALALLGIGLAGVAGGTLYRRRRS